MTASHVAIHRRLLNGNFVESCSGDRCGVLTRKQIYGGRTGAAPNVSYRQIGFENTVKLSDPRQRRTALPLYAMSGRPACNQVRT